MSASSHWRVAVRLLAIAAFIVSGGAAVARDVAGIRLALLPPPVTLPPVAAAEREPFGLSVARHSPLAERWDRLQPVIGVEARFLALCGADPARCTPAATRFLAIINAARARTGLARIGEINRAVNLAIRPMSDMRQFGVADLWATPLMTFTTGAGDCEDYAIAKYVALRVAGVAARDLRLVILHNSPTHEDHAVTAVRFEGRWLILDNLRMTLIADTEMRNVRPLLALNSAADRVAPVIAAARSATPATARDHKLAGGVVGVTRLVSDLFLPDTSTAAIIFRHPVAG
ncbi:MAG TPA: transglutaminase-like cysteine peptidase [Pseudolabrys sp.]|jgi:predicted transglutaminase-like cysteine proteinase|nr:transglutaminase-like cysteine peptidase [Pseudolabrys sp.]